jgi:hypothetical protein
LRKRSADLDELVVGEEDGAGTVEAQTVLVLGDGGSVGEVREEVCLEERERDGGGSNYREYIERSRAEGLQAFEVWCHGENLI